MCSNARLYLFVRNPTAQVGNTLFTQRSINVAARTATKRSTSDQNVLNVATLLADNSATYCFYIIGVLKLLHRYWFCLCILILCSSHRIKIRIILATFNKEYLLVQIEKRSFLDGDPDILFSFNAHSGELVLIKTPSKSIALTLVIYATTSCEGIDY